MEFLTSLLRLNALRLGIKVLTAIILTETAIMGAYYLIGISPASLWAGIADALMLGLISSFVILIWVIRPLKLAKAQNDLFNTVVNNLDVGVVVTDPQQQDHPIIYTNPAFTRITGYEASEASGRNPRFLRGDDVDRQALAASKAAIKKGVPTRIVQRNQRKDGQPFWNDLHLNPITGPDGAVNLWVGLINDVTATKALTEDNHLLASAVRQLDEAVCVFDRNGNIEFANDAFCNNVQVAPDAVTDCCAFDFWDQDSVQFDALLMSLKQAESWSGRHLRHRSDGSSYEALSSISPITSASDEVTFISIHRDITEMVTLEEQLRQSQKMEAVGMLVGGIAHDFNNLLAGMLGNIYLVRTRLKGHPELAKRLEDVEAQGYGAAGMVRQLLSFSRKDVPDVKTIDLVPFIKELTKFARVSVPEDLGFTCRTPERELKAKCDPVQLQQSVLNLIVNATHAVKEKIAVLGPDDTAYQGQIEIVLSRRAPAQQTYADGHAAALQWICIDVRDNGIGMDEASRQQVFEPFYTTKPASTGTGLGLAMVKGYIEALGGAVELESTPGAGSCLSLFLIEAVADQLDIGGNESALLQGNGELILIADDNSYVLEALSALLEGANYRVLIAENGEQALQTFNDHAGALDMAILDMVMPKASGLQVAECIRKKNSTIPLVMMTGYDKQGALLSKHDGDYPVLRKPWSVENLNRILAQSKCTKP